MAEHTNLVVGVSRHRRRRSVSSLRVIATILVFAMSLASCLQVAFISIPATQPNPAVGFVDGGGGTRRKLGGKNSNITSSWSQGVAPMTMTQVSNRVIRYYELEEEISREAKQFMHPSETAYSRATIVQSPQPPWFAPKKICKERCCAETVAISLHQDERRIINTLDGLDLADILIRYNRPSARARVFAQVLSERVLPCLRPGTIFHLDNSEKTVTYFFEKLRPRITVPFILMTTESDGNSPILKREKLSDDDLLIKWYGTNPYFLPTPKFVPFPLGLSKQHDQNNFLSPYLALTNYTNPFLDKGRWTSRVEDLSIDDVFVRFSVKKTSLRRQVILDRICKDQNTTDGISCRPSTKPAGPSQTYAAASSYLFGLSPPGNGYDCYRTYELLLLGVIPIVAYNPSSEQLFEGLPVVHLRNMFDDSTNATQNYVNAARDYINSDEFRDSEFGGWERLFLRYWRRGILKDAGRDEDVLADDRGREYYQAWRYTPVDDFPILCSDERHCVSDSYPPPP